MKRQYQQESNDCTRACIATILNLPIAEVPNFVAMGGSWVKRVREFLRPFGMTVMNVAFTGDEDSPPDGVLCLAGGAGPRGVDHHVVWRDKQVVWDPYPGGGGLLAPPDDYLLFLPLDASRLTELEDLTFSSVQERLAAWAKDHTPPMSKDEVIGGIVGEVGELAHVLRYTKHRRKGGNPSLSNESDCIGDIVLFVVRYCIEAGLDMAKCVEMALSEVEQRHYVEVAHDALHPFGQCTCGGEGGCDWCKKPCPECGNKWAECVCECGPKIVLPGDVPEPEVTLDELAYDIAMNTPEPTEIMSEERTIDRARLVAMLRDIYRNDRTHYEHHEPRSWDGKTPDSYDGTIWLTPREIAVHALRAMG